MAGAAVVSDRPDRADIERSDHGANIVGHRGPREPGVKLVNSIELPATKNLAHEIVARAKDRQVPNRISAEIVGGVVIRRPTLRVVVNRVGLIGYETRTFRRDLLKVYWTLAETPW